MKVLVLGKGGREHALAWRLRRDEGVEEVFCLPGNPGIAEVATLLPGDPCDPAGVVEAARRCGADLVVVGPEAPLFAGVSDALREAGIAVLGPSREAAILEESKAFAKEFMFRHEIPTAPYQIFEDFDQAIRFLDHNPSFPVVVKADGPAGGKGVTVAETREEAERALRSLLVEGALGQAGRRVVLEQYLTGDELSVFALTDGKRVEILGAATDYKRLLEGDRGPNTGGMGALTPPPFCSPALLDRIRRHVVEPCVRGMAAEGRPYQGILYAGLMVKKHDFWVLEFNVRFGDPEAQVLLPLLEGNLSRAALAAARGDLGEGSGLSLRDQAAVCVVLASPGYPHSPDSRLEIEIGGLDRAVQVRDTLIFHAGTALVDGRLVSAGGRVLNVVGMGPFLPRARERAYDAVARISFPGGYFRRDIALKYA